MHASTIFLCLEMESKLVSIPKIPMGTWRARLSWPRNKLRNNAYLNTLTYAHCYTGTSKHNETRARTRKYMQSCITVSILSPARARALSSPPPPGLLASEAHVGRRVVAVDFEDAAANCRCRCARSQYKRACNHPY
eukprot:Tamp_01952.p3 GENE.Tamp_01952~~Tamp_01952.p3  ORF type:complete len:136 (+),score=6.65 Tamp_01952:1168-1575(+)